MLMLAFLPPLRLVVLIAYVAAVAATPAISATPSLTVRTSTSNVNVDGLENLKVTTTIVNTGDETLKLLNDPRGVLNPSPEDAFTIIGPSGSRPSFSGDSASYNSTHVANLNHPGPFTVIAPGESINVTHDLPAAYSFAQSGAGDYSIEPSNLFTYVDADGTPKDLYATVEGIAKVKHSGSPAVPRHIHDERAILKPKTKFRNCLDEQQDVIKSAIRAAKKSAAKARISIESVKGVTHQYTIWFGPYDPKRKERVMATLKGIKDNLSKITYDCACRQEEADSSHSTLLAYSRISKNMLMLVCDRFWDPSTDQEAALIHEATHFHAIGNGVGDYAHGKGSARSLAIKGPGQAVMNADSYKFFALEFWK